MKREYETQEPIGQYRAKECSQTYLRDSSIEESYKTGLEKICLEDVSCRGE